MKHHLEALQHRENKARKYVNKDEAFKTARRSFKFCLELTLTTHEGDEDLCSEDAAPVTGNGSVQLRNKWKTKSVFPKNLLSITWLGRGRILFVSFCFCCFVFCWFLGCWLSVLVYRRWRGEKTDLVLLTERDLNTAVTEGTKMYLFC